MKIKQMYEIYEILEEFEIIDYKSIIGENIRKFRLELYNKYRLEYNKARRFNNPYSAENIAVYLGVTSSYYRQLENGNAKSCISIDKLLKLAYIFDNVVHNGLYMIYPLYSPSYFLNHT